MGNTGKSINDMFKEMAEQEALKHGNILIIIFPFISWSVNNLSFTVHQLSLMAKEPNNQGQSLSECVIKIDTPLNVWVLSLALLETMA